MDAMQMAGGAIVSSPGGGNSAIFGPDGRCLSEFVNATTETIIYADLDMDDLLRPHLAF